MAYGIRERAVMIALAALGGSASNAKLKNEFGFDFSGRKHKPLRKDGKIDVAGCARGTITPTPVIHRTSRECRVLALSR
jgi:hypothetical protein